MKSARALALGSILKGLLVSAAATLLGMLLLAAAVIYLDVSDEMCIRDRSKAHRSARGPRSFRTFIVPGSMYGGARQFLPWKIPFP